MFAFMNVCAHAQITLFTQLSPTIFEKLLRLVAPLILKSNKKREAISPAERLSVALRYLSTGDSDQTIAFSYRLGHSTVNKIIPETCKAIWNALSPVYVQHPSTAKDWEDVAQEFWEVGICLFALVLLMESPANSGSLYFNFNGSFSIVLMALCSTRYSFLLVNIRAIGDGGTFEKSGMKDSLYNGAHDLPDDTNLPNHGKSCNETLWRSFFRA